MEVCVFAVRAHNYSAGFLLACHMKDNTEIDIPNVIECDDISQKKKVWVCRIDV